MVCSCYTNVKEYQHKKGNENYSVKVIFMIIKELIRKELIDEYGLHHLQNILLNIMCYIDELCRKNSIQYYIIGGTALGAVRHGGFIPWDDDLDIAMTRSNYKKFCNICREQLDTDNYFFQESLVDWPMYFSKIRLKGTYLEEEEYERNIPKDLRGIFIDIFPLDNVPNSKIKQYLWYLLGKILVSFGLQRRGYKSANRLKKILMFLSSPLYIRPIHNAILGYMQSYNKKNTDYIGGFELISRFKNTITPKEIWGESKYVKFEETELQAPSNIKGFLEYYFGDYMILPPKEKRLSRHVTSINFGEY